MTTCDERCSKCLYATPKYEYICTAFPKGQATCSAACEYCTYGTKRPIEYNCQLKHTTIKVR